MRFLSLEILLKYLSDESDLERERERERDCKQDVSRFVSTNRESERDISSKRFLWRCPMQIMDRSLH